MLFAAAAFACAVTAPGPPAPGPPAPPFSFAVPALNEVRGSLAIVCEFDGGLRHSAFAVAANNGATFFITATSAICDMSDPAQCPTVVPLRMPPDAFVDATIVAGGPNEPSSRLTLLEATVPLPARPAPVRVVRFGDLQNGQPVATATANWADDPPLLGALLAPSSTTARFGLVHAMGGDSRYLGAPLFDPVSGDVVGVDVGIPDDFGLARGVGPAEVDNLLKEAEARGPGIGHVASAEVRPAAAVRRDAFERVRRSIWRLTLPKSDKEPDVFSAAPEVATAFAVASDAQKTYFVTAAHALQCDPKEKPIRSIAKLSPPGVSPDGITPDNSFTVQRIYGGSCRNVDDIAVLRADSADVLRVAHAAAAPLAFAHRLEAQTPVAALGIPPNEDNTVVASPGDLVELANGGATMIHGAYTVRGFSGGPVVTRDGELAAVVHGDGADPAHFEGIGVARIMAALRAAGVPPISGADDAARVFTAAPSAFNSWLTTLYRDQDRYDAALVRGANAGDGAAEAALGNAFAFGHGVPPSASAAASWDAKSAAAGDPRGTYQLATDYAEGRGVPRQPGLAYQTLVRAAALKYPPAMIAAATWSGGGTGAPDPSAAGRWLNAANAAKAWQAPFLLLRADPSGRLPFDDAPCTADTGPDPLAAYVRGIAFAYGFGRPRDVQCGVALVQASAKAGVPYAGLFLGHAYETGALVERDSNKAIASYASAADAGSDEGAVLAATGVIATAGADPGYVRKAFAYLLRAKGDGDSRGLELFGRALLAGFGTARDPGAAYNVFQTAAAAGLASAHGDLAMCSMRGCGNAVPRPPDLAGAERELRAGATGGDPDAIARLAAAYASGTFGGVPDRPHAAAVYDTFAAGNEPAQRLLHARGMLAYGAGDAATTTRAVALLESAAFAGHAPAQFALGSLYDAGTAVERSDFEAATWYFRAAARGDDDAAFAIAKLYRDGRAVRANPASVTVFLKRAAYSNAAAMTALAESESVRTSTGDRITLYARAARRGFRMAQFHLGEAYATGAGVPQNAGCAALWYKRSARPRANGELDDAGVFWQSRYVDAAARQQRAVAALAALPPDIAARVTAQAGGDVLDEWFSDCSTP